MPLAFSFAQMLSALLLAALAVVYTVAWLRMRTRRARLAHPGRPIFFLLGLALAWIALAGPVAGLSETLLTGRSVQKALLCMLAPPLIWLGLPFHVLAGVLPPQVRRGVRLGPLLRRITHAPAAWLLFLCAFLLWHDPTFVDWSLAHSGFHTGAAWLLLLTGILFWWHVVNTGPRLHRRLPSWIMALYLLGVEIPNMAAGITIAFTIRPLYLGYFELHQAGASLPFDYATDQMTSGAIIWVFGSVIYIGAIIGVLYRLFRREGVNAPRPIVGWDDAEKVIAPGLEHRVRQQKPDIPW